MISIKIGSKIRYLGSRPSQNPLRRYLKKALPESDWTSFDERDCPVKIEDQDGKGACNGHAAATALALARYVAGYDHVRLSPWYVYSILCNGVDRGSNIMDALNLSTTRGVAEWDKVPYGTINPRQLHPTSHDSANRFKIEIGEALPGWPEIMTAVQLRRPINLSVCVGQRFDRLSREGVAGVDPGIGNHAVCVYGGAKKVSGKWAVLMWNSWSEKWGDGGYCWLTEDHFKTQRYFEAYTVHSVIEDPENPVLHG